MLKTGKKASKPGINSPHVVSDYRTATFYNEYVSLTTVDERIEADYVLPDEDSDTPHTEYLFFDEYETTEAERHRKHSEWQLHSHCRKEMESHTPRQATPENRIGTILWG
ncbi:MAG: hypothetical protein J07HQW1_01469 [Haloquadratum walsbyi J07HQW1]|jgi:hypothetical protein|uniref:Transposase n=1 Tax=Haloquadratum walsbyi J07HQW1 TaxID=1238424 RepID=U1N4F1_9EURY|nr:MAG: hypothetical protein J07HQW1_01469 [Haloquadratum walsbyi J07HQW1]